MIPRRLQRRPQRAPRYVIEFPGHITPEDAQVFLEHFERARRKGLGTVLMSSGATVKVLRP